MYSIKMFKVKQIKLSDFFPLFYYLVYLKKFGTCFIICRNLKEPKLSKTKMQGPIEKG